MGLRRRRRPNDRLQLVRQIGNRMSLLPFFQWCEASSLGAAIRNSVWLFPAIEAVHLLGLAMLGGLVLLLDIRLMGFGVQRKPLAKLAKEVEPWLTSSLLVMLATGALLY